MKEDQAEWCDHQNGRGKRAKGDQRAFEFAPTMFVFAFRVHCH
jgi:hypothetical protein